MATRGPANPRAALYIAVFMLIVKTLVIEKGGSEALEQDDDQGGRQGGDQNGADKSSADLVEPQRGVHRMHGGSPSFVFGRLSPLGFVNRMIVSDFPEVMNAATSFLTINR
jgi:hypothetical protein